MQTIQPPASNFIQAYRRLLLFIILTGLDFTAGFGWGRSYGYVEGKAAILRHAEQRLKPANQPPPA